MLGAGPSHGRRIHVLKKAITLLSAAVIAVGAGFVSTAYAEGKTYYWVSHGSPADPVWTYFLAGAKQWAEDTGNTVNTSFQNGDVPAHQEAIRAAISAGAAGIATTSPDPGSLVEVVKEANAKGIPIINFNTPDPQANFDAYVGGDNKTFGRNWAQYLVDKKLVKSGDFVWMPVEVPGATYGVQEEEGIASVFKPLNITWEVTDATLDQAEIITRMSDYLTANRSKIKAIIGLGDLVNGSIKRVFEQVGVKPGEIPVIGWGNSTDTTQEVLNGYVNAAQWQDPQATSYMALSMAAMAASKIPPGFSIITGALYEKDTAEFYDKILSAK
jgi:simple sugar transport system substrate-binding protein